MPALGIEQDGVAGLDAYGWPHTLSDDQLLERLLALNLDRAQQTHPSHQPAPIP